MRSLFRDRDIDVFFLCLVGPRGPVRPQGPQASRGVHPPRKCPRDLQRVGERRERRDCRAAGGGRRGQTRQDAVLCHGPAPRCEGRSYGRGAPRPIARVATRDLPRRLPRARRADLLLRYAPPLARSCRRVTDRLTDCAHTGFLRQWPALPTYGVFLTTTMLPVPHVEDGDRYVVSRVDALPGFYGVTQYLGFRDAVELHFEEITARIADIEDRFAG